jgi:site-specific recombinase XerD
MEARAMKNKVLFVKKINEGEFRKYLKRRGKRPAVVDRNVGVLKDFISYLLEKREKNLDGVTTDDIDAFVMEIESKKQSAKGYLYVLMNYFHFLGNNNLLNHAKTLREERTKKTRRIFPIKEFLNINQDHVKKLAAIGIKNVEQMLEKGKTKKQREQLSKQLDIPEEAILELVKLSDITRIGYVKKKLSRLYYDVGLDSPAKIAEFEPKQLHEYFVKFVEESGWKGMVPNPSDLVSNIKSARKLSKIVEE